MSSQPAPRALLIVFWVVWFAVLNGVILMRLFLAKSQPAAAEPIPDAFPWMVSLLPALVSGGIRWLLLPRADHANSALSLHLVGLAAAEATTVFGLFLTPSKMDLLCGISFLAVFQFAPTWAARFFPEEDRSPTKPNLPQPPQ